MQKISFTVDGKKLAAAIFYPEKPKEKNPAILFVQGWTSKKERSYQYAEALSGLGYICFLFDNLGHGESEGDIQTLTIKEFLEGAIAAYDYFLNVPGVDRNKVSAIGQSFGGYLIALLCGKRDLKNLVLRVPADYKNEDFGKSKFLASGVTTPEVIAWRKQKRKVNESYALTGINNFDGAVLIIESGKDDIVPRETIENYMGAVKNKENLTHVIVKDAPHSIKEGRFRDEITKILVEWFKDKI
jgi:esterase/lipase